VHCTNEAVDLSSLAVSAVAAAGRDMTGSEVVGRSAVPCVVSDEETSTAGASVLADICLMPYCKTTVSSTVSSEWVVDSHGPDAVHTHASLPIKSLTILAQYLTLILTKFCSWLKTHLFGLAYGSTS